MSEFVGPDAAAARIEQLRQRPGVAARVAATRRLMRDLDELGVGPMQLRTRDCGCAWYQLNRVLFRFVHVCDRHSEVCRELEDWEIKLARGDG